MPSNSAGAPLRSILAALALTVLGLPGVVSLLPTLPHIPGVSPAALLINPLIFLAVAAFVGAVMAPRCGFRSRLAERVSGLPARVMPPGAGSLLGLGLGLGVAMTLADHALGPLWQEHPAFPPSLVEAWSPAALLLGLLYGGLVEEIIIRWGLMSLLVWFFWRISDRSATQAPQPAVLAGLLVSAAVFAVSHLPALAAAGAEMTWPLLIRTIGFNLSLGLVFGWLFARRDLESAMLAHIGFHLGVVLVALPFAF